MKSKNSIENSMFFKQNMKIKKNLWKPYTLVLLVSFMLVLIKGIN